MPLLCKPQGPICAQLLHLKEALWCCYHREHRGTLQEPRREFALAPATTAAAVVAAAVVVVVIVVAVAVDVVGVLIASWLGQPALADLGCDAPCGWQHTGTASLPTTNKKRSQ